MHGNGAQPYCGMPPEPAEILSRWNLDPALLGILLVSGIGCSWLAPQQTRKWVYLAWAVLFVCFVSPLCAMTSALFSARAVHHVLLIAVAAPLIALGMPQRGAAFLAPATIVHIAILWAWHVPAIYTAALSNDLVYWSLQAGLGLSAVAMWSAIFARPAAGLFALLAVMTQMGVLGALLTFAPSLLYADHLSSAPSWGFTALEDQQMGGVVMWVISLPLYVAVAAALAIRRVQSLMREAAA